MEWLPLALGAPARAPTDLQISVRVLGLRLFELEITEQTANLPAVMISDVTSIPVYQVPDEESVDEDGDEEGRIRIGFQQKNGK